MDLGGVRERSEYDLHVLYKILKELTNWEKRKVPIFQESMAEFLSFYRELAFVLMA